MRPLPRRRTRDGSAARSQAPSDRPVTGRAGSGPAAGLWPSGPAPDYAAARVPADRRAAPATGTLPAPPAASSVTGNRACSRESAIICAARRLVSLHRTEAGRGNIQYQHDGPQARRLPTATGAIQQFLPRRARLCRTGAGKANCEGSRVREIALQANTGARSCPCHRPVHAALDPGRSRKPSRRRCSAHREAGSSRQPAAKAADGRPGSRRHRLGSEQSQQRQQTIIDRRRHLLQRRRRYRQGLRFPIAVPLRASVSRAIQFPGTTTGGGCQSASDSSRSNSADQTHPRRHRPAQLDQSTHAR